MPMIKNVMLDWKEMEGDTDEVRKLNSLLTSAFIGTQDIPSDECLTHAQALLGHFHAPVGDKPWSEGTRDYLRSMFAEGFNGKGERVRLAQFDPAVDDAVTRAEAIIKGGPWPDRLVVV